MLNAFIVPIKSLDACSKESSETLDMIDAVWLTANSCASVKSPYVLANSPNDCVTSWMLRPSSFDCDTADENNESTLMPSLATRLISIKDASICMISLPTDLKPLITA